MAARVRDRPIEHPCALPGQVSECEDGILVESIDVALDGAAAVPNASGLGIELDMGQRQHYGHRFFEITSRGTALNTMRERRLLTALRPARKRRL